MNGQEWMGRMMDMKVFIIHIILQVFILANYYLYLILIGFSICYYIGRQATIAVRFSHLRKQFDGNNGEEAQIIQYQMQ